jgi:hypothetical protein
MDVVPKLDPKFSNTRWSKLSEGRLQTSPDAKGRRAWTNILPLVHTNGSVKKLILFLLGHALLQSSRTEFSVAWLEIFRPGTRCCHIWRTSTIPLKTSQSCDEIQEDLQICTSQISINGRKTTAIKFQLKPEASKTTKELEICRIRARTKDKQYAKKRQKSKTKHLLKMLVVTTELLPELG